MIATLALIMAAAPAQDAAKTVFKDRALGLSFEHPKEWKVRKERFYTNFEVPTAGGTSVQVQLFSAVFRDKAETWQSLQVEINTSLGRKVDRQWQEELLGVPMLLTKVSSVEAEKSVVSVIGLLYAASADKMQFRLTGAGDVADEGQQKWWEALLTLRTMSGELPVEEDPSKPIEELQPKVPQNEIVLRRPVKMTLEGRAMRLVPFADRQVDVPEPWAVGSDGVLSRPGLKGRLVLGIVAGAAEEAGAALESAAAEALPGFSAVRLRTDTIAGEAPSGALVASVVREGVDSAGGLVIGHWVGLCPDASWQLKYTAHDAGDWRADQKLIAGLAQRLFLPALP